MADEETELLVGEESHKEDTETGNLPAALPDPRLLMRKRDNEKRFTDAVIVRRLDKTDLAVPMTPEGLRNANIITAELYRDLVEQAIKTALDGGRPLTPKELEDLKKAAQGAIEIANHAQLTALQQTGQGGVSGSYGSDPADIRSPGGFIAVVQNLDSIAKNMTKNVTPKNAKS